MSVLRFADEISDALGGFNPTTLASYRARTMLQRGHAEAVALADEPFYRRGLDRLWDMCGATTFDAQAVMFRKFIWHIMGKTDDRAILFFIGKIPDDQLPEPDDLFQFFDEVFVPGRDTRQEIARLAARIVKDPGDYEDMLRRVSPDMAEMIGAYRAKHEWLDERMAGINFDDPNISVPMDPPIQDYLPSGTFLEDFGFGMAQGMTEGRRAWLMHGLRGWGWPERYNVTREISLPHPDYPRVPDPAHPNNAVFGSIEGWCTWNPRRDSVISDATAAFSRMYREAFGGRYHAGHGGAHSLGFSSFDDNLIAVDPRINLSFMARWEGYARFYQRRYGAVYLKVQALDVDMVPVPGTDTELPVVRSLRYELFVPDADGNPRQVLRRNLDATWRPGYTNRQLEGFYRAHYSEKYAALAEADRMTRRYLSGENLEGQF